MQGRRDSDGDSQEATEDTGLDHELPHMFCRDLRPQLVNHMSLVALGHWTACFWAFLILSVYSVSLGN